MVQVWLEGRHVAATEVTLFITERVALSNGMQFKPHTRRAELRDVNDLVVVRLPLLVSQAKPDPCLLALESS